MPERSEATAEGDAAPQSRLDPSYEAILSQADIVELRDILDYANKFHHDTNPAYETEAINDQELAHFCDRTLRFARRD